VVVRRTPIRGSSQRGDDPVTASMCPVGTFSPTNAMSKPLRSSTAGSSVPILSTLLLCPASANG